MTEYDVKRLGLILAIQAEIEGMKAENQHREMQGYSQAYGFDNFHEKAEEIRVIVSKHDHQL